MGPAYRRGGGLSPRRRAAAEVTNADFRPSGCPVINAVLVNADLANADCGPLGCPAAPAPARCSLLGRLGRPLRPGAGGGRASA